MSYILEALRKADQERVAGAVPDLESAHQAVHPAQRSFRWIWILVALLVVNGGLMVLLATRDTGTGVTHTAESPVTGLAQDTSGSLQPAVPVDRATAAMQVVPKTVLFQDRPDAAVPVIPPVTTASPAGKSAGSAAVVPAASGKAQPPVAAASVQAAPVETPKQGLKDWVDLSLEFRSGLELPPLDVHVYDADPQRRFVLINLRKYRAGDRLESGAVIEEILPDGVQLSYQGTRFRYRK
ncbi:MAG: general secretion pathway protein GspB [Gammaproteobacteria bacterium]|nr:general secretion pathway protein GspB [Gammaproteobacteria bacterium]MDH3560413.1 general secretion pathway protein GspB [Gammaproteobacteria bacterium]